MLNRNDDDREDKKEKQEEKGEAAVVLRVCVFESGGGVYLRTMVFLKKLKSL